MFQKTAMKPPSGKKEEDEMEASTPSTSSLRPTPRRIKEEDTLKRESLPELDQSDTNK